MTEGAVVEAKGRALRVFMARVDRSGGPARCWPWQGPVKANGYGIGGRFIGERLAHRTTYRLFVGPIPAGLTLDHLCRRKLCVNPAHLEPVSLVENIRRATAARTECAQGHPYGDSNTYRTRGGHRACRVCHRTSEITRKRRLGVRPARRLGPAVERQLLDWSADGVSQNEIARRLGLNSGTVNRALRRLAA